MHSNLIAVVDDEQPIRVALRRLLQSAGFPVEVFESGTEFIESLGTRQPACVVLDLHMPKGNGFSVLEALAQKGLRVPVVVVTGHDDIFTCERALAGGAAAFLRKPVDDKTLLEAIARVMNPAPQHANGGKHP